MHMWDHPVDMERVSYVLSNLQREKLTASAPQEDGAPPTRRRNAAHDARVVTVTDVVGADAEGDVERGAVFDSPAPFVDALSMNAPPRLKPRRSCCFTIVGLWALVVVCACTVTCLQIYHTHIRDAEEARAFERRVARDDTITDVLEFGIWDSMSKLTPLQLQVAISLALGVRADDGDVNVSEQENSFFVLRVNHATVEESDFINSDAFVSTLNKHTVYYEGKCVLSKRARLIKPNLHHSTLSDPLQR